MDLRKTQLQKWAAQAVLPFCGQELPANDLQTVSGDASFRRYFRLAAGSATFIAVDAPPEVENSELFTTIAGLFSEAGVSTPRVLASDYALGFMLLDDFGDSLYLPVLTLECRKGNKESALADLLYGKAIAALVKIQKGVPKDKLAHFDSDKLHTEMQLFPHWFCEKLLELALSEHERAMIVETFNVLAESALSQVQTAVHRDYHSRNLMILDEDKFSADATPGIIDFQDAVVGPCSYDIVSLLRDCYIRWPDEQIQKWALQYWQLAQQQQIIPQSVGQQQFIQNFDLMGLQRHLKVMGIFARLAIRDNKPRYLADIPLVMSYFRDVASRYQMLENFVDWFEQRVVPAAAARWARD